MKKFNITIKSKKLKRGLRPSERNSRNNHFLITCNGAIGYDGVLQAIDQLTRIDTGDSDSFPYPQIFVFVNAILVCTQTKVYEWVNDALVLKITVSLGSTWVALDFYKYIYLSNGRVSVIKNALTGEYSETTDLPTAMAAVNFNGQVLLGAPDSGYES